MPNQPLRRTRGSYARLICLQCRKRRIKCLLPEEGEIQPSKYPQPPEKACQRCRRKALDCVVDSTTLGRPRRNLERPDSDGSYSRSPAEFDGVRERSPSPYLEDFVLTNPDGDPSRRAATFTDEASISQLLRAITKTYDATCALLARDGRLGMLTASSRIAVQQPVYELVNESQARLFDEHLIWQRLYHPHLPSLASLYDDLRNGSTHPNAGASTALLFALCCSIALDIRSDRLKPHRHLQPAFSSVIHQAGQEVLFKVPTHDHALMSLELLETYRPLSVIDGPAAATHALSGRLYTKLAANLTQQLGLDSAAQRLRTALNNQEDTISTKLISDTLRRCAWLMGDVQLEGYIGTQMQDQNGTVLETLHTVFLALNTAADPDQSDLVLNYYCYEFVALSTEAIHKMTREWKNVEVIAKTVQTLQDKYSHSLRQLSNVLEHRSQIDISSKDIHLQVLGAVLYSTLVNVESLGVFYEVMSRSIPTKPDDENSAKAKEFLGSVAKGLTDATQQKLVNFITLSKLRWKGVLFAGPPRQIATDVLFACKTIVEHNSGLMKIKGSLHPNIEAQLTLLEETSQCLEAIEVDGRSRDAIGKGSLLAASAQLIRSLRHVMVKWKKNEERQRPSASSQEAGSSTLQSAGPSSFVSGTSFDEFYIDDFFTDWSNWPQVDSGEVWNLLFDVNGGNVPPQ